jgi:hypothetical protein
MTCHIDACDCRGVNREGAERWQRSRAEPAGGGRVVMVIVSLFRDGFSAVVLTEDAYAVCFTVVFDVNRTGTGFTSTHESRHASRRGPFYYLINAHCQRARAECSCKP